MITNNDQLTFEDISSEEYRVYEFPGNSTVIIKNPTHLNVSRSGGHRVLDNERISHYIPKGWIHLSWKAKEDKPAFVK